jgi:hypothetical protein
MNLSGVVGAGFLWTRIANKDSIGREKPADFGRQC